MQRVMGLGDGLIVLLRANADRMVAACMVVSALAIGAVFSLLLRVL